MSLKWIHRCSAVVLGAFILSHLTVHLFALGGADAHAEALSRVQGVYRNPAGESLLVIAILVQIASGCLRLKAKPWRGWSLAQAVSGVYLAAFLVLHTSAALLTQKVRGLETDFLWAAGSLAFSPIKFGFAVYYFLAVLAVFVHLAAAIRFAAPRVLRPLAWATPVAGAAVAAAIVAVFAGAFYPIVPSDEVAAYYVDYFGWAGVSPQAE
ncbi:hypothetical protein GC169_10030 [bacterium]|nr:hypothetical protein [bacterium]